MLTTKVLLIGTEGSGKTSIVNCLLNKPFDDKEAPTIGLDYKSTKLPDGSILGLWDASGSEHYAELFEMDGYFKDSHVVMCVFSADQKFSEQVEKIKKVLAARPKDSKAVSPDIYCVFTKNDFLADDTLFSSPNGKWTTLPDEKSTALTDVEKFSKEMGASRTFSLNAKDSKSCQPLIDAFVARRQVQASAVQATVVPTSVTKLSVFASSIKHALVSVIKPPAPNSRAGAGPGNSVTS